MSALLSVYASEGSCRCFQANCTKGKNWCQKIHVQCFSLNWQQVRSFKIMNWGILNRNRYVASRPKLTTWARNKETFSIAVITFLYTHRLVCIVPCYHFSIIPCHITISMSIHYIANLTASFAYVLEYLTQNGIL